MSLDPFASSHCLRSRCVLSHRLRGRLRDAGLELVAEILDCRLQRLHRSRCVSAKCAARAEETAELLENLDVAGPALTALERREEPYAPRQALTAGSAPSAGFA